MDSIIITSAFFKLGFACVAIALMFTTLRVMDNMLGYDFGELFEKIKADEKAAAQYLAARVIAVAIVIGSSIG